MHPTIVPNMHTKTTKSLNNQGHLGKRYQGLPKYIVTNKVGLSISQNIPSYRECARSSIAKTFFLIEREFEIHVNTKETSFLIQQ